MDAMGRFFSRVFGGVVDRLFDRIRYALSDAAESRIRDTIEKPLSQLGTNRSQSKSNYQDPRA